MDRIDIDAGVVGLAVARALAVAWREMIVPEQHGHSGSETSARNSQMILSAVTINTPQLMQISGLGPGSYLQNKAFL